MNVSGATDSAVAEDFLYLGRKHDKVTEVICRRRFYRERHVTTSRRFKQQLVHCHKWSSHLNKEEIMMIGDLDQQEADNIISPSLEKSILSEEEEEEEEEEYVCKTFQDRLLARNLDQLMAGLPVPSASSCNEEFFVDRRFNESDDGGIRTYVLRGHTVNSIGADVQDYRMKMEPLPGRWKRRLV